MWVYTSMAYFFQIKQFEAAKLGLHEDSEESSTSKALMHHELI
jgi:hypothetical protein